MTEESKEANKKESKINKFLKDKKAKKLEYIVAIIVNIIFLYIVNNLVNWNISFISDSFTSVLWIFNISIIANILVNILFLIYFKDWIKAISQIILNILGILVVYFLYTIFPFTVSAWIAYAIKIAFIIAVIAMIIATFVEAIRLILKYIVKIES
ncbi:hypothetical protein MXE27_01915 [Methanobacterium alcaliphilum]|nr:hypothetical protein [Methanobacterium alcaliphilum]MCK9150700.1 hypothetical protein [Methanobacterium alcaliphilum]